MCDGTVFGFLGITPGVDYHFDDDIRINKLKTRFAAIFISMHELFDQSISMKVQVKIVVNDKNLQIIPTYYKYHGARKTTTDNNEKNICVYKKNMVGNNSSVLQALSMWNASTAVEQSLIMMKRVWCQKLQYYLFFSLFIHTFSASAIY